MITEVNEKPSERLQFALDALIEAEKPGAAVKPYMNLFHKFDKEENKCFACLGGLAAIKRYGLDPRAIQISIDTGCATAPGKEIELAQYEGGLDLVRHGCIGSYFMTMGLEKAAGDEYTRVIPDYRIHPKEFKQALVELINDLKKDGY